MLRTVGSFISVFIVSAKNFAVVLDAGSTGTRAHIFEYEWNDSLCGGEGAVQLIVPEINLKVKPGISTIDTQPSSVKSYLSDLKSFLDDNITVDKDYQTPIFFRATAGVRLLPTSHANELMTNVLKELMTWDHYFADESTVRIMSGKEEGVYGWFFLNQLLGKFPEDMQMIHQKSLLDNADNLGLQSQLEVHDPTRAALFEVGGASAQIVVQVGEHSVDNSDIHETLKRKKKSPPTINSDVTPYSWTVSGLSRHKNAVSLSESLNYTDSVSSNDESNEALLSSPLEAAAAALSAVRKGATRQLTVCGRKFDLFSWSFQGLGRQQALESLLDFEAANGVVHDQIADHATEIRRAPCLGAGVSKEVRRGIDGSKVVLVGSGSMDECVKSVSDSVLAGLMWSSAHSVSKEEMAIDNGNSILEAENLVHETIRKGPVYCVENCHYYNKEIINSNGLTSISPSYFKKKAEELCPLSIVEMLPLVHSMADEEKIESACFGLILHWMMTTKMLGLSDDHMMSVTNDVAGVGLSWVAAVIMLDMPIYKKLHTANSNLKQIYEEEIKLGIDEGILIGMPNIESDYTENQDTPTVEQDKTLLNTIPQDHMRDEL